MDQYPSVGNGWVVWQAGSADQEIWFWNDGALVQLTDNDYGDFRPETDGQTIVWYTQPDGAANAVMRWTPADGTRRITPEALPAVQPDVAGDVIVFSGWDGNDYEIFFRYLGINYQITENDYPDLEPAVDGNRIVWQGRDDSGSHIYYAILNGLDGGEVAGACCVGFLCDLRPESECIGSGGIFVGRNTFCDISSCPEAVAPARGWSTFQHDAQRTGRSGATISAERNRIWSLSTGGIRTGNALTIGPEGIIYYDGGKIAVDSDGNYLWTTASFGDGPRTTVSVRQDGRFWAGSTVRSNVDGSWTCGTDSSAERPNALDAAGNCYVANSFGGNVHVTKTAADCDFVWTYTGEQGPTSGLALGHDGGVYVGGEFFLAKIDPVNGGELWSIPTEATSGAAAIGPNGTVYLHVAPNTLLAVNPDGNERWRLRLTGLRNVQTAPSPAIGVDGTVYVVSNTWPALKPTLVAVSNSGEELWRYTENISVGHAGLSPVIDAGGTILFAVESGDVVALSPEDGRELWRLDVSVNTSPAIGENGTIYVTTEEGRMIAFGEGCPEDVTLAPPYTFRLVAQEGDDINGLVIEDFEEFEIDRDGLVVFKAQVSGSLSSAVFTELPNGEFESVTRGSIVGGHEIYSVFMPRKDDNGRTYMPASVVDVGPAVFVNDELFLRAGGPNVIELAPVILHDFDETFFDFNSAGTTLRLYGQESKNDPWSMLSVQVSNGDIHLWLSIGSAVGNLTIESVDFGRLDEHHVGTGSSTFVVHGQVGLRRRAAVTNDSSIYVIDGHTVNGKAVRRFSSPQSDDGFPVFLADFLGGNGIFDATRQLVATGDVVDGYAISEIVAHSMTNDVSAFTATLDDGRIGVFRGGAAVAVEDDTSIEGSIVQQIQPDVVRKNESGDVAFIATTAGGNPTVFVASGADEAMGYRRVVSVGDVLGGHIFDFSGGYVHCPRDDAAGVRYQNVPTGGGIQTVLADELVVAQHEDAGAVARLQLAEFDPSLFGVGNGGYVVVAGKIDDADPYSIVRINVEADTMNSVIQVGDPISGIGTVEEIRFDPTDARHVNASGDVAFVVASITDGVEAVASVGAPYIKTGDVVGEYTVRTFAQPQINDSGTIAYRAMTDHPEQGPGDGVFLLGGTRLVGSGDRFGGFVLERWNHNAFQERGINSMGTAVVSGAFGGVGAVLTQAGPLIRSGEEIDGSILVGFDRPQIRNNGEVVFLGRYGAGQAAWFTETARIVGTGDVLDHGTVSALGAGQINQAGQHAYSVVFAEDGGRAIYLDNQAVVVQGETLLAGVVPAFLPINAVRLNEARQVAFLARTNGGEDAIYVATPTGDPKSPFSFRRAAGVGDVVAGVRVNQISDFRLQDSGLISFSAAGSGGAAFLETSEGMFNAWRVGDEVGGLTISNTPVAPLTDASGAVYLLAETQGPGNVAFVDGRLIVQEERDPIIAPIVVRSLFVSNSWEFTARDDGTFTALVQFELNGPSAWSLIDPSAETITPLLVIGQEFDRREFVSIETFALHDDDTIAYVSRVAGIPNSRGLFVMASDLIIEGETFIDGHEVKTINPVAVRYNAAKQVAFLTQLVGESESLYVGTPIGDPNRPSSYSYRRVASVGDVIDGATVEEFTDFRLTSDGLARFVSLGDTPAQFIETSEGAFEVILDQHSIPGKPVVSLDDLRMDDAQRVSFRSGDTADTMTLFSEVGRGTFTTLSSGDEVAGLTLDFSLATPFAPRKDSAGTEFLFVPVDPVGLTVFVNREPLAHAYYEVPEDPILRIENFEWNNYVDHDESGTFLVFGRLGLFGPNILAVDTETRLIRPLLSVGDIIDGSLINDLYPSTVRGYGDDGIVVARAGLYNQGFGIVTNESVIVRTGDYVDGHLLEKLDMPRRNANGFIYYRGNQSIFSHSPEGIDAFERGAGDALFGQPVIQIDSYDINSPSDGLGAGIKPDLAYRATMLGNVGLFVNDNPVAVSDRTTINGLGVTDVAAEVSLNDSGQVVFVAHLDDETVGLFVATPQMTFDANSNGTIDLFDYAGFQSCVTGPDATVTPECKVFDSNGDCRCDMIDYLWFQLMYSGSID